jgi:hypothetical protein
MSSFLLSPDDLEPRFDAGVKLGSKHSLLSHLGQMTGIGINNNFNVSAITFNID